ncbi:MAG: universal stress protein [Rhodospirillales bacterium]|jgi:nucleotide-binding universal stress UspA family protein|nr:universal stress protein [Rhodospirillales bacterium]
MKTLLLPLLVDESVEAALATAHMVAKRYGSYIEGLFIRSAPPMVPRAPVPAHFLNQYRDYWDESADVARKRFTTFMNDQNVTFREITSDATGPNAWWREIEGEADDVVGEYGRLFDMIVMARASSKTSGEWSSLYDAALFDSGRPLLIAPETPPETLGENIVISWNASTETARTIAFGMPFLKDAKKVCVLSVEGAVGGMVPGPSGDQVAAHLVRGGVAAVAETVQANGRSSGKTVLEEAERLGADLLVKGAFTHNRLRQMIFGGTTRHVLTEAKMPVLIAH